MEMQRNLYNKIKEIEEAKAKKAEEERKRLDANVGSSPNISSTNLDSIENNENGGKQE